ncbi:hypothetical protein CLPUN_35600 [Clostridium puniceum]|uniref:DUF1540 domain-containing protein n=1 Tax=Clostridium puniceum TaxID=29367 RepID=A0A1S8TBI9_9CLOT|nr:DUF1540 domain-containing protein [Clostridium puniceum]OOM75123.1 hypothetical protein CLPUN_35600 [Clostridium puniceum]
MLVKCEWKACRNYKDGICRAEVIELKSFDYEEDNEELEGLKCSSYKYDSFWMCENGREVDSKDFNKGVNEIE